LRANAWQLPRADELLVTGVARRNPNQIKSASGKVRKGQSFACHLYRPFHSILAAAEHLQLPKACLFLSMFLQILFSIWIGSLGDEMMRRMTRAVALFDDTYSFLALLHLRLKEGSKAKASESLAVSFFAVSSSFRLLCIFICMP
jgi:hypothetical protein